MGINSFGWKEDYILGVEKVDDQHKNLLAIASRLEDELSPEQQQQELMNLYRYTREHFKAEEELMRASAYPDYPSHRKLHDDLLNALNNKVDEIARSPDRLPLLRQFLSDWIINHILVQDQRIAHHLQSRRE